MVCAGLVLAELTGALGRDSWWLAVVAGPTLLLDLLDGYVARRTGTETASGARFDAEVDAAMVAILSVGIAPVVPPALLVGASRYLLALGAALRPAWRASVPPRRSRKRAAATVAALLWLTTLQLTPVYAAWAAVLVALALLGWSFLTQIIELEQQARRRAQPVLDGPTDPPPPTPAVLHGEG